MKEGQVKKLYIMQTLEVLKKYSDYDHRLRQNDIISLMERDYGTICERKSVARNISNLMDLGYEIVKDNGYYLAERNFEDSELRLLIDSVMASRHIPEKQSKDLVEKLLQESSVYFKKQMRHVCNLDNMYHDKSNGLFYTVDVLSDAIDKKNKVRFFFNKYKIDKGLHHTTEEMHIVNPYQIVVANGKYYLIGNIDKYDTLTHFRVEKISDIEMLDVPAKEQRKIKELKNGLDLPTHMMEHIYMFSGESNIITLKVQEKGIDNCIDWLGKEIDIKPCKDEGYVIIKVKTNVNAMKYWAIQYGEIVEVLEPLELREEIKKSVNEVANKYN